MARTPEEKATNDAIETAIDEYRKAYKDAHPDAKYGALVDWIVVAAEVVPGDDPEDDVTAYSIVMPGGNMPSYRAVGLLRAGLYYLDMPSNVED